MAPKTLLRNQYYAPAAKALLERFKVPAHVEQMRGILATTPGQAATTSKQCRSLDTLATPTDGGEIERSISSMTARPFDEMPQPKK